MATTNPPPTHILNAADSDDEFYDDRESLASIETDDGEDHPPEKIIAELQSKHGHVWYLVKWKDCPVLRSSWEGLDCFSKFPWMLNDWVEEKRKQDEGISKPLNIVAFNKAVLEIELADRQRRILRRLKRSVNRVLSIVTA